MFRFNRSNVAGRSERSRGRSVRLLKGRGRWLVLCVCWLSLLLLYACGEAGQTPTDVPTVLAPQSSPEATTIPQTNPATIATSQTSPVPPTAPQISPTLPATAHPQPSPTTVPTTQAVTPGPTKANEAHSLQLVKTSPALPGHDGTVKAVAFSPNGKLLVSGSYDGTIKLWQMPQASLLKTWEAGFGILSLAFSPDGKTLLTNGDGPTVILWDVASGQKRATLPIPTTIPASNDYKITVDAVAFSPDGQKFAGAADDGTLVIWNALNRKPLVTIQGYEAGQELEFVYGGTLSFSPDGKKLASGSQGDNPQQNVVRVWQVADGQPIATFTVDDQQERWRTTAVVFSPDGKKLAASDFWGRVKIWDAVTFSQTPIVSFEVGEVNFLAFSPDSKLLACGSGYTPTGVQHIPETIAGYTLGLWDASTGKQITDLKGHAQTVYAVAFSPDGKTLASGSMDSTIKLWQVTSGNLLTTLKGNTALVQVSAFSPDHKLLANGGDNGSLELLNVQTGQLIAHFQAHFGSVVSLNFSPDGQKLFSTASLHRNGFELKSWSVKDNSLIAENLVYGQLLQAAAISSDGKLIATANYSQIALWDTQTLQKTGQLNTGNQNVYALAFSPDGRELAVNSNSFANIWDVADGKLLQNLGVIEEDGKLVFSPDGRWLAVANGKGVQVWNWQAATSQTDLVFDPSLNNTGLTGGKRHPDFIGFSPEGRYLIITSSNEYWNEEGTKKGLVQVWDWQRQQQVGQSPVDTFGAIYAEWNATSQQVWAVYDNGIIKTWKYQ